MAVSDDASFLDNPSIRLPGYKHLAFSFDGIMNGVFVTILDMFKYLLPRILHLWILFPTASAQNWHILLVQYMLEISSLTSEGMLTCSSY